MLDESSIITNLDETYDMLLNDSTSTDFDKQLDVTENTRLVQASSVYKSIEEELAEDRLSGKVVSDTFTEGSFCCDGSIFCFHDYFYLYLLFFVFFFLFWFFIFISYVSCPLPEKSSSSMISPKYWCECDVKSTLCEISLSISFISHVLAVVMRLPPMIGYRKDLFNDGGKEYDLIDMMKIYVFKGPLDRHKMMSLLMRYVLTFIITIILNVSTIMRGITNWNVPDVCCFFVGLYFLLTYVDFNDNTIMLRNALLKGTHIMGFNSIKRETLKLIMNRFKSDSGTSFNLQCLDCFRVRKRMLMHSMKITYLESSVIVILSYYYVLSNLPFNAFSLSVLNLSTIGMVCTTIASIHHNRSIDKIENVIKAIKEAQSKGTFKKYGTITDVDLEALRKNSVLKLDGDITHLRVTLFGIPVSDAFFLNIIIIVFTSVARIVFPPLVR